MADQTIYSGWARYYDALHSFKDYRDEATRLNEVIRRFHPDARSLLDVACGTGRHLQYLQKALDVEGLDANAELLEMARARSPGIAWHCGRMETFELQKRYDVISCLFSSIGFVRTREALQQTFNNLASHLRPGGLLIIEPWFSLENFWADRVNAHFVDEPELKIAWMYTTALENNESVLANEFLIGTPTGMERIQEKQVLGLFSPEEYLSALRNAGFEVVMTVGLGPEWKRGLHVAVHDGATRMRRGG